MPDNHSNPKNLRTRLTILKAELDGELIPLGRSLGKDDEGLLAAMEVLSERITMYCASDKSTVEENKPNGKDDFEKALEQSD